MDTIGIHHMSVAQLQQLETLFASPSCGKHHIIWDIPKWLANAYIYGGFNHVSNAPVAKRYAFTHRSLHPRRVVRADKNIFLSA